MKIRKSLVEQMVREEVQKIQRIKKLQEEKSTIKKQLNELYEDDIMDEGIFGPSKEERKKAIEKRVDELLNQFKTKYPNRVSELQGSKEEVMAAAEANNYRGQVRLGQSPKTGVPALWYVKGDSPLGSFGGAARGTTIIGRE